MQFGPLNYTILIIYLAAMVSIGAWWSRRQRTTEDYFLAGRRMPWLVVAMSVFASLTSGNSYLGVPRTGYHENVSMIVGYLTAPIVAVILIAFFMPFYHRLRVTTTYEYVDKRFGQSARFAVASLFMLARLGWLGTVIFGPAMALNVVSGIPLWLTILLIGALATIYTSLGGLSAVLWTDMVQFIILVGGAIWVAVTLILAVPDGIVGIWQIAEGGGQTGGFNWRITLTQMSATTALIAIFFASLHDFGTDQITVQRLLAIRRFSDVAKALMTNAVFTILIMGLLLFLGIGMFAYYSTYPDRLGEGINQDKILPFYIVQALPVGVSGLVITAIFAVAMSSMDSGIHSLSTVIVNDFVRPLRGKPHSDHQDLVLARVLVLVLGTVATVVAFWVSSFDHILDAAATFFGMFNGPILALFVLGMFTRRGHFAGWLVGVVPAVGLLGLITLLEYFKEQTALYPYYQDLLVFLDSSAEGEAHAKLHWYYRFPVSFLTCFTIGYLASLVIKGPRANPDLTIWRRQTAGASGN